MSTVINSVASQGLPGPAPTVTWEGTTIVVNGVEGPDLQGETGVTKRFFTIQAKDRSAVIQTGVIDGFIDCPFAGTLTAWQIGTDVDSTCSVRVLKNGANVSGSAPAQVSADTYAKSTALTGWTVDFVEGDRLTFNVLTNDNAKTISLKLYAEESNA